MPTSKISEEKSAGTAGEEAMPETTTRGSRTGEDMPRPDMTPPETRKIGEMPPSEMAEEKSNRRKTASRGE
jgi:hypothetical protein